MDKSKMELDRFSEAVFSSDIISPVLEALGTDLHEEYWVGAGAIAQTVWNYLTNRPSGYGIHDIDIAYFDAADLSEHEEKRRETGLTRMLKAIPVPLDVKNQARVHRWYEQKFGYEITPYKDLEDAVATWPTTATAVAVRLGRGDGSLNVIAPFGLSDLLSLTVRPNKRQITREIYAKYVRRWGELWPELRMEEWTH